MKTRKEAIDYCLSYPGVYEDYPFDDPNWTVIRHKTGKRRGFAWIFERQGRIWINVKCDPDWADIIRSTFPSVIPAYHMNKTHWNSIILDGTIPDEEIHKMLLESYTLTGK